MQVTNMKQEDAYWDSVDGVSPFLKSVLIAEAVEHSKQKRALRERFSERVFWFAVVWAGFLVTVLLMEAFNWRLFHLDYRVLVALIAGTSAGIIGLLAAVVKYIFPEK